MVHQRKINKRQRQLVNGALAKLPKGANPIEGEDPETSARRPGCEHANSCISVACAGNWEALSCGACEIFKVPEDHTDKLLELAGRGGVTWSEYSGGLKNADVGPIRQALKKIPEAHGKSWVDEKETSMATQSAFEKLDGEALALVQRMVGSNSTDFAGAYNLIKKAAGKKPVASLAAFRMYIIGRRKKRDGGTPPRKKRSTQKTTKKAKRKSKTPTTEKMPRVSVSHPEKLAQIAVTIVTEVANLDPNDRARVFDAVDRLLV